jgi:hypothetical protein
MLALLRMNIVSCFARCVLTSSLSHLVGVTYLSTLLRGLRTSHYGGSKVVIQVVQGEYKKNL